MEATRPHEIESETRSGRGLTFPRATSIQRGPSRPIDALPATAGLFKPHGYTKCTTSSCTLSSCSPSYSETGPCIGGR